MDDTPKNDDVMLDLTTDENYLFAKDNCRDCLGRGWVRYLPPHKVKSEVVKYNKKGNPSVRQQVNPLETRPCDCLLAVMKKELRRNPESRFKNGEFKEITDIVDNRQMVVISEKAEKIPEDNENEQAVVE